MDASNIKPGTTLRMRGTTVTINEARGTRASYPFGDEVYVYHATRNDTNVSGLIELGPTANLSIVQV